MRKELGRDSAEFKMFADYWRLVQDFYAVEDTDAYWDQLVNACSDFCKKYPVNYATDLAAAYVDMQQKRYERQKGAQK